MSNLKKTFVYKFFPSKEEETCKVTRELIEIQDIYPPPIIDLRNPRPFLSLKRTFFYKFFPSKEEEAACKVNNTPWVVTRELIAIWDVLYTPPRIKKKITHDEIALGMLVIPFFEMFEYILRYWRLDMAKSLVENRCEVRVKLWDVTEENDPKKYERRSICLRKLNNDDYSLSCKEMLINRRLGVGDEIGLFWDPRSSSLTFNYFLRLCDPKKDIVSLVEIGICSSFMFKFCKRFKK